MLLNTLILGKENVGKSTFFNRIAGKNVSITHSTAGVTRDNVTSVCNLYELVFCSTDTPGWNFKNKLPNCYSEIRNNFLSRVINYDLIFFVVDVISGITNEDLVLSKEIIKYKKDVILVANKSDSSIIISNKKWLILGLGQPIYVSSTHFIGFDYIYKKIKLFSILKSNMSNDINPVIFSIIGRPNVGKSTFFNRILGFERSVVSKISGTTRDLISCPLVFRGKDIVLIDSPGTRKRNGIGNVIEILSVNQTLKLIQKSNIVFLVLDASNFLQLQDLKLANLLFKYNILFCIIINKFDLIVDKKFFIDNINFLLKKKLSQFKDITVFYTSIHSNINHNSIFSKLLLFWDKFNAIINSTLLNVWLYDFKKKNVLIKNVNKIMYVMQCQVSPPHFKFYFNLPYDFMYDLSLRRLIFISLSWRFNLQGVPIRISLVGSNSFIAL